MFPRLCVIVWMLCGASAFAADRTPDVTLTGSISGSEQETYREVPFEVPPGVVRITIDLSYTGKKEESTNIDLGLRDPERLRGWSGGNKSHVVIEEADATTSYLPGPLPAGTWHVILGVSNIRKTSTSNFTVKVLLDRADVPFPGFAMKPIKTGLAWYRGDMHMHTAHSDGSCLSRRGVRVPCPVFKTLQAAVARGLDFISITDHNSTAQNQSMRELGPYFDDLLLIPGREVTTFKGHANVFGPTGTFEFELGSPHVPDISKLLDEVKAAHGLISINHPGVTSGEECMGCGWRATDVDYARIDAIEAVNGGTVNSIGSAEARWSSIPFWEERLNAGFRVTGIGDSDNHNPDDPPNEASAIGVPTTVVHARELSQDAVLDAIRAGHVFVDVTGSRNRVLEVEAIARSAHAEMGDVLEAPRGTKVTVSVHVTGAPDGAVLKPTGSAASLVKFKDPALVSIDDHKTFELIASGKPQWLRVDVRDRDGKLLLLGNPIYFRGPLTRADARPLPQGER